MIKALDKGISHRQNAVSNISDCLYHAMSITSDKFCCCLSALFIFDKLAGIMLDCHVGQV